MDSTSERTRTPSPDKKEPVDRSIAKSVNLRLVVPIQIEGAMTDTLTVHRLKVRERLDLGKKHKSDEEKEVALVAAATHLAPSDVEELDLADFNAVQEIMQDFFSARAAT